MYVDDEFVESNVVNIIYNNEKDAMNDLIKWGYILHEGMLINKVDNAVGIADIVCLNNN